MCTLILVCGGPKLSRPRARKEKLSKEKKNTRVQAIKKAETLNYLSNIPALINFFLGKKIFNVCIKNKGHTCLSYTWWYLSELSLYDIKYLNDDYYKLNQLAFTKQNKNYIFNGLIVNYKLVGANNVGKKDISKFNPYKWAYYLSFFFKHNHVVYH